MPSLSLSRRSLIRAGGIAVLPFAVRSSGVAQQPAPRPLSVLQGEAFSVLELIPAPLHAPIRTGENREDLAPFINRGIAMLAARPGGGALFFPPGFYDVSEIDASNADPAAFSRLLRLVGAGRMATKIRPLRPGGVLLNGLGRNELQVESLEFDSARFPSQTAILLGRTAASPNCNGNAFRDLLVSGSYSRSSVVSLAAESTSWSQCEFRNTNAAARHRCFATSHDPAAVPVKAVHGGAAVPNSNTDNVMVDCEFYAPHEGAEPVLFAGSAGYTMHACTVLGGSANGTRLVTYRPDKDVFTGPVTWTNPHLEVFGKDNVVHWLDAPAGVSYFRGINSYSGNYVVPSKTDLLGFRRSDPSRQPVLMGSTWTVPQVPWDARDVGFRVYALVDSAIAFRLGEQTGTLEVTGFASNSRFDASYQAVAKVVPPGAAR